MPAPSTPADPAPADLTRLAARVIEALRAADATVATAESLTGGLVCAALVDVPGASAAVRGGIVAYDAQLKASLLGVPAAVLEAHGPVSVAVAEAMAVGARATAGATWSVATTGAAGPEPHGGRPAGVFVVAVAGPEGFVISAQGQAAGTRAQVRRAAVRAGLELLWNAVTAA